MRLHTLPAALVVLAVSAVPAPVLAYSFGITGQSRSGCNASGGCHGTLSGATVTLMGPSTLAPGATGSFSLVITSSRAGFIRGGLDVSTSAGTLVTSPSEPNTMISMGELIHGAPIDKGSDGTVTVPFSVEAPAAGTCLTLYAAGNATSGNGTSNTAWAVTTHQVSLGGAGCGGASDGGAATDAGATGDASAEGDGAILYDPQYSMGYGGCAVAPGVSHPRRGPSVVALLVAGIALAARRRHS